MSIVVRVGQTWIRIDAAGRERKFRITRIASDVGSNLFGGAGRRVFASYIATHKPVGGLMLKTLERGERYRLVEDAEERAPWTPPRDKGQKEPARRPERLRWPKGLLPAERARLRDRIALLDLRGRSEQQIADECRIAIDLVRAVLDERRAVA